MKIKKIAYNGALGDTTCLAYVVCYLIHIGYFDKVKVYCNYPEIFNGLCLSEPLKKNIIVKKAYSQKKYIKNRTIYKIVRDFLHLIKFYLMGIEYISWTKTYLQRNVPLNEIFLKSLNPKADINKFYSFNFKPWIKIEYLENDKNKIIIAPEAGWKCRELPYKTTKNILKQNELNDFDHLVIGSKKVKDEYNFMNDQRGNFDFNQLIKEILHAKLVITADSGIFHLASILRKDIIAVFGPVYPNLRQYPHNNSKIYFKHDLLCIGCSTRIDISKFNTHCPYGHTRCMDF